MPYIAKQDILMLLLGWRSFNNICEWVGVAKGWISSSIAKHGRIQSTMWSPSKKMQRFKCSFDNNLYNLTLILNAKVWGLSGKSPAIVNMNGMVCLTSM